MQADIVVIGSGISGLTAAVILARNGKEVVVIEQNGRIGGALKRFTRKGHHFDVGFHYTGCVDDTGILSRIWNYCGILKELEIIPFPKHGSDKLSLEQHSEEINAFFNYQDFAAELKAHFPNEKSAIDEYFGTIRKICSAIPFYNLDLPVTPFLRGYKGTASPLKAYISELTDNSALQSVFAAPALLYGIPTDNVSIDIHAMVAHGYYQGAYSIGGGGQAIVNAFKSACDKNGVTFITGDRVVKIETDNTGVCGITCASGEKVGCRKVVFTGHPSQLFTILENDGFRPAYKKRLTGLKNTVSMNIVFGTIPSANSSQNWHNYVFLPDGPNPLQKSYDHDDNRLLMMTSTERGSNCLQQQSKSVILLQPAHWQEVEPFSHSTPRTRSSQYKEHKQAVTDTMIAQAKQLWHDSFKGFTTVTSGTPLTLRDQLYAPEGCAYGASHSLDQYTPDIRTRLPGLYLSGQSTLMTGIAGSSIAGMITAGELIGLESLWDEVRSCR